MLHVCHASVGLDVGDLTANAGAGAAPCAALAQHVQRGLVHALQQVLLVLLLPPPAGGMSATAGMLPCKEVAAAKKRLLMGA